MYEDWGGSPEWEEKPRSCVCVHVALDAVQVGQTDGYSRWWWDDAIVKRRDSGRKRKCSSECRSCATLLSITSTRYRRNDCWWKVEGRRSMVNGACDRVSSGEVRDVSQYVVGMSLLLFPNCDTRNGKYFIGSSQQPQTLSCLAVPSLATGKLALLAFLFLAERASRADDDCPAARQHLLFFLQGCSAFPRPALSCAFIPELCSEKEEILPEQGRVLPTRYTASGSATAFQPSAAQLPPSSYEAFNVARRAPGTSAWLSASPHRPNGHARL